MNVMIILLLKLDTRGHLMSFYKMEIYQKLATVGRPGVTLSEIFIRRPEVTFVPKSM